MVLPYATIELVNQYDEYKHQDGEIDANEIRRWSGEMLIDTGAIRLAINEEIRTQLGLRKGMMTNVTLADGSLTQIEMIGGVKVRFGDRICYTGAFVLPGNTEPLMGCIPLEEMDLVIIPSENILEYNPKHPDGALFSLK